MTNKINGEFAANQMESFLFRHSIPPYDSLKGREREQVKSIVRLAKTVGLICERGQDRFSVEQQERSLAELLNKGDERLIGRLILGGSSDRVIDIPGELVGTVELTDYVMTVIVPALQHDLAQNEQDQLRSLSEIRRDYLSALYGLSR